MVDVLEPRLPMPETTLIKRLEAREKQFGIVPADQLVTPEDRADQYARLEKMVGHTPLESLYPRNGNKIWIKNESENPTECHYDRASVAVLKTLEGKGFIKPGDTLLEGTSGSAGRSFAYFCSRLGFKLDMIVPQELPPERGRDMLTFGTNLIRADKPGGMGPVIEKFRRTLVGFRRNGYKEEEGEQFSLEGKPVIIFEKGDHVVCAPNHSEIPITPRSFGQIAKEVLEQLPPGIQIDAFIGTLGNGATIKGISEVLKEKFPDLKIIGTEDYRSPTNAVRKLELEFPDNPEMVRQKFKEKYGVKMPDPKDFTYHDSFGASTPSSYKPAFIELDKIDEIVLMGDEWRDLKRRKNTYAVLLNNVPNAIGNTSAENRYLASVLALYGGLRNKNILVMTYDKGDQYADWPPAQRTYARPQPIRFLDAQQEPKDKLPLGFEAASRILE